MKRKSIVISLLTLLLIFPILALAAPVGKFTSLEGNVDVTSAGKEAAPANLGDPLNVGDIIRTKSKSKCEVAFIDGSILRLAENTRLRVSEFTQEKEQRNTTLNLFRGKIQNVVKTVTGDAAARSKYEIHTPTSVAGVRGTNFFSFFQGGVSGTIFKEGRGYGYSLHRPQDIRTINAGQAMLVTSPDLPPVIKPATSLELNQHEKDTTPSEKPKGEGKKEEDKKSETLAAKIDDAKKEATELKEDISKAGGDNATVDAVMDILAGKEDVSSLKGVEKFLPDTSFDPIKDVCTGAECVPQQLPIKLTDLTSFSGEVTLDFMGSQSGKLSGSITTTGTGSVQLSGILPVNSTGLPAGAWGGTASGTIGKDTFAGYLAGVSGTWEGLFSTIYYLSDTEAGYLIGSISGDYNAATKSMTGSGQAQMYTTMGNPANNAIETWGSLSPLSATGYPLPNLGTISIGEGVYIIPTTLAEGAIEGVTVTTTAGTGVAATSSERKLGVWGIATNGGTYTPASHFVGQTRVITFAPWSGIYGQNGSFNDSSPYYMLGQVSGTDDGSGHTAVSGKLTYMDEQYLGAVTLDYRGKYDVNQALQQGYGGYQSAGAGTYTLDRLAFGGTANGGLLYYQAQTGSLEHGGYIQGLLGGTDSLWNDAPAGITLMGSYTDTAGTGPYLMYGSGVYLSGYNHPISGDSPDGNFYGYLVGLWRNNNIRDKALALYIRQQINGNGQPVYTAGYLKSVDQAGASADIAGYYYPGTGMWEAVGYLKANAALIGDGTTSYSPAGVIASGSNIPSAITGYIFSGNAGQGSFNGGGTLQVRTAAGDPLRISDQNWGIWNAGFGGTYEGTTSNGWTVQTGGNFQENNYGKVEGGYWLGTLAGTSWGDPDPELGGTFAQIALTDSARYDLTGDIVGTQRVTGEGSGEWQAAGLGTMVRKELAYSGRIFNGGFAYWNSDLKQIINESLIAPYPLLSPINGILGGTDSLFAGFNELTGQYQSSPLVGLGSYMPATASDYSLWATEVTGSAGADAQFITYYGGIHIGSSLKGRSLGIYVKGPAISGKYEAGIIKSNYIVANLYSGIGMWALDPTNENALTASPMGTTTVSPANLLARDTAFVNLKQGSFTAPIGDGAISGQLSGESLMLPDQPWGIMYIGMGGGYTAAPAANWNAKVGKGDIGTGAAGYWYKNYWVGTISGGAWDEQTNSFSASLSGRELNIDSQGDNYLGISSADIMGTYGNNTYQSIGLGASVSTPLAYNGSWGEVGSLYYNNQGAMTLAGHETGIFGGVTAPWNGQADFTAIGTYQTYHTQALPYIWYSYVEGFDRNAGSSYEGYFQGSTAGLWSKGNMTGATRAIYITPPSSGKVTAGVLAGNILGNYYSGINMWAVLDNEIAPSATAKTDNLLLSEIYAGGNTLNLPNIDIDYSSFTAAWSGKFASGANSSIQGGASDYLAGSTTFVTKNMGTINRESLNWGTYDLTLEKYGTVNNSYSGKPSDVGGVPSTWSGMIGGKGSFGTPLNTNNIGYWLATMSGTWSDDGEIIGTLGTDPQHPDSGTYGIYLTPKQGGIIGGPFFGVSDIPSEGSGTWIGASVGSYEATPLAFGGMVNGGFQYYTAQGFASPANSSISGLWGAPTVLFSGNTGTMAAMGNYTSNFQGNLLFAATLDGYSEAANEASAAGFVGGTAANHKLAASAYGFYAKPLANGKAEIGFLTSNSSDSLITGDVSGFWGLAGNVSVLKMDEISGDTLIIPMLDNGFSSVPITSAIANEYTDGPVISIAAEQTRSGSLGYNWGIWQTISGGSHPYTAETIPSATVNTAWTVPDVSGTASGAAYRVAETSWDTDGTFSGKVAVATVNWAEAQTFVGGGEVKGTFNPTAQTWQSVATGAWMETGRFIGMQGNAETTETASATLKALNIPAVQVGKATLNQVNPATAVNNLTNVTMNNVGFFAYSTGSAPSIWGTNSVTGSYSAAPLVGEQAVTLTGGGLTASFGISNWTPGSGSVPGTWGAQVTSTGANNILATNINQTNNYNIQFKGAAAGTIVPGIGSAGTFNGTGAGIVTSATPVSK